MTTWFYCYGVSRFAAGGPWCALVCCFQLVGGGSHGSEQQKPGGVLLVVFVLFPTLETVFCDPGGNGGKICSCGAAFRLDGVGWWFRGVWCYAGAMLVLCWRYAGAMLALCWCYAGAMLVLCWCYAGAMLVLCLTE